MKIGISSRCFEYTDEYFRQLAENKINAIEISRRPGLYDLINYEEISRLSKAYNIMLWSYHLPFTPVEEIELASLDSEVRKYTIKYLGELIKKASDIGVGKFVVHSSREFEGERDEKIKYAMESLDILAEIANKEGAIICVEDLPRSCIGNTSDEILELLSANDKLRVCLDTNHLMQEDVLSFVERVGDKIATLHISDYDFVNERHWLPGEGVIDWKKLYKALCDCGYDGVWMYEIGFACPKTIIRDRDLNFGDFYRNANEIFSGSDLTVISRPKENLGFWE